MFGDLIFGGCFLTIGVVIGLWIGDEIASRRAQRVHEDHMGVYNSPALARAFYLRSLEEDRKLRTMPLRQYHETLARRSGEFPTGE